MYIELKIIENKLIKTMNNKLIRVIELEDSTSSIQFQIIYIDSTQFFLLILYAYARIIEIMFFNFTPEIYLGS